MYGGVVSLACIVIAILAFVSGTEPGMAIGGILSFIAVVCLGWMFLGFNNRHKEKQQRLNNITERQNRLLSECQSKKNSIYRALLQLFKNNRSLAYGKDRAGDTDQIVLMS